MKANDKCFIFFMILLLGLAYTATDIYLPALPAIQQYFNISVNQAQYTFTIYLFGLVFAQIVAGPIIDHIGYRRTLLPLLFIFVVITLFCVVSQSFIFFIIMRFIQALTAGIISVLARASFIIRFSPERAAYIVTTFGQFIMLSGVFAPVIGGIIAHYSHWQGVFIFLAIYSAIILFAVSGCFYVNEKVGSNSSLKLTYIVKTYITILTNRQFLQYVVVNCMALGIFFAYVTEAPFIYHQVGYSTQEIGLSFIPLSFSFLIASQLNKIWYHKLKMDLVLVVSLIFILVGLVIIATPMFFQNNYLAVVFGIAITAFGLGLVQPLASGDASLLFPKQASYAAGMITALPFIFSVLLTLIVHSICGNNVAILSLFLASTALICAFLYYFLGMRFYNLPS